MDYWDNPNTYRKPVWIANLSNGEVLYQEDYNGEDEPIAWLRLKKKIESEGLKIENFGLKYCDNEVWLGPAEGYYFTNGAAAYMHGPTFYLKNIGKIENNKLKVRTYRCPELLLVDEDEREINENVILNQLKV
jgi:hypothetical protein